MRTYYIWTIGCQMNTADSARLAADLETLGLRPVARPGDADVVVLNTCVVRQSAEDRAIGRLTSLKPLKERRPDTILAVMGCLVGTEPDEAVLARFSHVDLFLPPSDGHALLELVQERQRATRKRLVAAPSADDRVRGMLVEPSRAAGGGSVPDALTTGPEASLTETAAYVPVIYGCNHRCAYCIVPFRRGRERSRPVEEIQAEVRGLVAGGARQVTLLGQIVDRYGYDLSSRSDQKRPDLADLLHAIHEIEGLRRIRFLTSHPAYLSQRIVQAVADLPKVCEHIEVPVQAGHDEVLRRMRRGYSVQGFRELVERIRDVLPEGSIASDVIVGFPGETEPQFQATLDLLEELRLDKVHVAAYSPRPGTWADRRLQDDVPEGEKRRRLEAVEAVQERVVGEINARLLGCSVEVLVEDLHRGKWRGRTATDKLVFFRDEADWRDRMARVEITWAGPWSMQGRVIADPCL